MSVQHDEALAKALQAQEYHRARHPSYRKEYGLGNGHAHSPARGRGSDHAHGRATGHSAVAGGPSAEDYANRHLLRDEQLRMALEVNPEAFVQVSMLYVPCSLNNVALKAFVDTGAQMTVMNLECAQRCNLVHLIDKRFKGIAAGVGVASICGRVHMATLRFGRNAAVDIAVMVMDMKGGPELLLGLDVMRK
mmetsp:Transcript_29479/g.71634  ORF Transcript_29479/g.71634 Transcript_29479/m.71634 type:complete len:192 (-) Transcript_29479:244-819(-)